MTCWGGFLGRCNSTRMNAGFLDLVGHANFSDSYGLFERVGNLSMVFVMTSFINRFFT